MALLTNSGRIAPAVWNAKWRDIIFQNLKSVTFASDRAERDREECRDDRLR